MQVRILEILEVSLPSRRSTCLFGYILHALACTFRYQAKLRLAIRNQGAVYGSKRGLLLRNPMQSIERNHEIKLVFEPQATSVRHLKSKVGQRRWTEVASGEANHVSRRIDTNDRALRSARSNLCCDLPVAAADIKDPLRTLEIEQSEYFLSHRFLQRRTARIFGGIPFCHVRVTRNVTIYPAFPVVSNDLSGPSRTGIICDGCGVVRCLYLSSDLHLRLRLRAWIPSLVLRHFHTTHS